MILDSAILDQSGTSSLMDIEHLCGRPHRLVPRSCTGVCGGPSTEFLLVANPRPDWCDVSSSVSNGSYNPWLELRSLFPAWRVAQYRRVSKWHRPNIISIGYNQWAGTFIPSFSFCITILDSLHSDREVKLDSEDELKEFGDNLYKYISPWDR